MRIINSKKIKSICLSVPTSQGYTVYLNGLLIQWGTVTTTETTSNITFLNYTSEYSFVIMSQPTTHFVDDTTTYLARATITSSGSASLVWYSQNASPRNKQWLTIGY